MSAASFFILRLGKIKIPVQRFVPMRSAVLFTLAAATAEAALFAGIGSPLRLTEPTTPRSALVASMPRRELTCLSLCAGTMLLPSLPSLATAAAETSTGRRCTSTSNPARTIKTCIATGIQQPGDRLSTCAADESCISTSSVSNPSKFAPPWAPSRLSPEASDGKRAFRALVSAIEDQPELNLQTVDFERGYVYATAPSSVPNDGVDDVEFILRAPVGSEPPTAIFRTATRQSVFVYPLQQPLTDQKSHLKRLTAIRTRLGWEELGATSDAEMEAQMGVSQVGNFFGFMRGVEVPE